MIVHIYGTLIFVAATQETPLDCLALVASGAYVHRSNKTVTEKQFLNRLYLQGTAQRQQIETPIFPSSPVRGIFAYFKSYCLRVCFQSACTRF